jgi:hypothetical protein
MSFWGGSTNYYTPEEKTPGLSDMWQDILGELNGQFAQNFLKGGKFQKQLLKDPGNSALAGAMRAGIAGAKRGFEESFTVDPNLMAAAPSLVADKINKGKQGIETSGLINMQSVLAQAQMRMYEMKKARQLAHWQSRLGAFGNRYGQNAGNVITERSRGFLDFLPMIAGAAMSAFGVPGGGLLGGGGGGMANNLPTVGGGGLTPMNPNSLIPGIGG